MKIQDFYKQVLTSLNFTVDDEGLVSFVAPDPDATPRPVAIDNKRLVLPTDALLKRGFGSELQPFHPIAENIARKGVSPVLGKLQQTAKAMVAHHVMELCEQLLIVAAEPSLHKDLPPECSEYLKKVPQADKKAVTKFQEIVKRAIRKNQLISIYLKNGGKIEGEKFNRVCVVRFPIMDHLETDEDDILGVSVRKKDIKTFNALMHYVVPMGDSPETYSAGSNSRVSPFFDAFLKAYAKIGKQINKQIHRFAKPLTLDLQPIDLTYEKTLPKLGEFYNKIPSLPGNEGKLAKGEDEAPEPPPNPQMTQSQQAQATPQPSQPTNLPPQTGGYGQPQMSQSASGPVGKDTVSFSDFKSQLYGGQPQQGYGHTPQAGYGQPQQMGYGYGQPQPTPTFGMAQPQPQQPVNPYMQSNAMFGNRGGAVPQGQYPQQPAPAGQSLPPWSSQGGGVL